LETSAASSDVNDEGSFSAKNPRSVGAVCESILRSGEIRLLGEQMVEMIERAVQSIARGRR
jgi:hypothetical protein